MSSGVHNNTGHVQLPEERRFLSTSEAAALERELLEEYRFGRQQLVELCGHASAVAVTKAFPLPSLSRKQRTVLVVCGPEQNGAVGLACARHLRVFEYQPSIFCPVRSADALHRDLTTQCEKMDIPFLSFLPAEVRLIDDAYGLVVDAVLGPGVPLAEAGGHCARALATLKRLSIPLAGMRRLAATQRTRCSLMCWCPLRRPRAAPAASPDVSTL
ncbi:yjeF N-terminal domain-containing protein 3 isoform X1 [Mus pahari]|uniref:yjeF N-terminal domain-containing protein 3 isoform X1 n=1 Tax=Mus pahari TaxID=10093 RepID=UPI001114D6D2|nr:yjeF N-terminal domain-containing protein 3 isoform X1 [Mus pahari]